ncbi:fatty acid synthase alpha subunit Lsd1 [Sorochytrium milnesiophthora]
MVRATVDAQQPTLLAVFGGQGNTKSYFDELAATYDAHKELLRPVLSACAKHLVQLAHANESIGFYAEGLDVLKWLNLPDSRPDTDYMLHPTISLPLIGLSQLLSYYTLVHSFASEWSAVRRWFVGATGHSQGIVSAVVVAASHDEQSFIDNTLKALTMLFHIGLRAVQAFPQTSLDPTIILDIQSNNEGTPSPMLVVSGLPIDQVQGHVDETNRQYGGARTEKHVHVALINGPRNVVVVGPPQSLYGLLLRLRKYQPASEDESRVPFSKRGVRFSARFLAVGAPFHTPYLSSAVDTIYADVKAAAGEFCAADLSMPVVSPCDGSDISHRATLTDASLTRHLVELICTHPVDWIQATSALPVTHIVDFGPGGLSGVGVLTHRYKEGTGTQIVLATVTNKDIDDTYHGIQGREALFDLRPSTARSAPNWATDFGPRLLRTADGRIHIDTKFSRLLGKPPVMVAGMTPTTVNAEFVSAVLNAGYHVELAGGGHYTEQAMRNVINRIINTVPAGEGITLNMLFLNARQWAFQYPLVQAMRREGLPIEGVCVAAGVPSLDVANDIVASLKSAGIKHIAFKPGSMQSIRQVLQIASFNPTMPIVMQWTGGRAGGHHSYEDMHAPILETYAAIRRHANVVLVAGSGFGGADDTIDYLTGDWSLKFKYPRMPFDGVLFGSRMLVAKEAKTSTSVKQLIVDAPGVDADGDWEGTYNGTTGGVVTVRSELGEPIHKIATRGVLLWKELENTLFSLPKEKRLQRLARTRDHIIQRLNRDYQKVWFGKKAEGQVADLREMTYVEVVWRMIELLHIKKSQRWIDASYKDIVCDFLRRLEERFTSPKGNEPIQSRVPASLDDDPLTSVADFLQQFPEAATQLLTTEDVYYFVSICQQRGRKPVTFIPVLDEHFETWFKKDSLWQSEFIEAVVDEDPQRVCVLQGPVAARHATRVDEPVAEILGNICAKHAQVFLKRYYNDKPELVPQAEFFGGSFPLLPAVDQAQPLNVQRIALSATQTAYHFRKHPLPDTDAWLETLLDGNAGWLCALLRSASIVQGKQLGDNVFRKVLQPRRDQLVLVESDQTGPVRIKLFLNLANVETMETAMPDMTITRQHDAIELRVVHQLQGRTAALTLKYRYVPTQGYALIHEVMQGRNERIRDFYAALWFDETEKRELMRVRDQSDDDAQVTFRGQHTVQRSDVDRFCRVVQNHSELFVDKGQPTLEAPMDYAVVVGWKSMISGLFLKSVEGDLLRLVHLSNSFRRLGKSTISEGDVVDSATELLAVVNTDTGKRIETKTVLSKQGQQVMEIRSAFFIRGRFTDYHHTFQKTVEDPTLVHVATDKDLTVLRSKEYIRWSPKAADIVRVGVDLVFRLRTHAQYHSRNIYAHIATTGTVTTQLSTGEVAEVAQIDFDCDMAHENPVTAFLGRFGRKIEQPVMFDNGGYTVGAIADQQEGGAVSLAPMYNEQYAAVSGDYNLIHTNPLVANLAALPGTITHGMWTSANTRKWIELYAARNQPQRVHSYAVSFVDMVLPGDKLRTSLRHVGMQAGRKIVSVQTVNQRGQVVVQGQAEVEQAKSCYVFTGQGSQEVGMGMDLYTSSPIAKQIWDRADTHFRHNYGFSILDIVRHNPKERTVYFGGPDGARIRDNYMAMTYDTVVNGVTQPVSLFPTVTAVTDAYTFRAPNGLLFATQFAQPALTLVEKAAFTDLEARGLVQIDSAFAGHSLGEYAALAAVGNVLPIEALVDVVFYRGMTMQHAVPRDRLNRSMYGMVAVNPSRVGAGFDQRALQHVVAAIAQQCGELLEIVNYNVDGWQYVVAGHLVCLDVLSNTCNAIKHLRIDLGALLQKMSQEEVLAKLAEIIVPFRDRAQEQVRQSSYITLERGYATIPLSAIDVPFHSSFLLPGVTPFREYLTKKIKPTFIKVDALIGRYIPNLVAAPFSLSHKYIQLVAEQSQSPVLRDILAQWSQSALEAADAEELQIIGHKLLIELLAYQFASAVRWIETQDRLLKEYSVQRFVEIGPTPTLVNMLHRTIQLKYTDYDDAMTHRRKALSYVNNRKELYYEFEDAKPAAPAATPVEAAPTAEAIAPSATPVAAAPARTRAAISDEPTPVLLILRAIVAHKLRRPYSELKGESTVKELVGGKSTLQNEILGDLTKEFGKALPEKAEEMTIAETASYIQPVHDGKAGAHASTVIAKLIANKMPGGFSLSTTKAYLQSRYGLGDVRSEAALLVAACSEPAQRLPSEQDGHKFLDAAVEVYARDVGVDLSAAAEQSDQSGGAVVLDAGALKEVTGRQRTLWAGQVRLLSEALEMDLTGDTQKTQEERQLAAQMKADLDMWLAEHGETYADGIRPVFSPKKVRRFDSSWNWVRQEALSLFFDIIFGRLEEVDRKLIAKCLHVMNRSDENTMRFMRYWISNCDESKGPTYKLVKSLGNQLLGNCEEAMDKDPVYKYVDYPTAPLTEVLSDGNVSYQETLRPGIRKMEAYVDEMRKGSSTLQLLPQELLAVKLQAMEGKSVPSPSEDEAKRPLPFLHCKSRSKYMGHAWCFDQVYTDVLFDVLQTVAESGLSLSNKQALLTGCGKDSIGSEILRGLLSAGAQVVVTTSRFGKEATEYYRAIYEQHGSKSSCLVVVPFNQGSKQDMEALIDYIYAAPEQGGLGWDLDFVIPFAAIPENGRELSDLDDKSELAHRMMLTNLLRMLGYIKTKKVAIHSQTRPAQVVLPLSPNHGSFGGDGLYGESKISLETLFNRWHSESWGRYLSIVGAVIGWTRGTGLMSANNLIAQGVEQLGVRTFSTAEMAFNILALLHPTIVCKAQTEPMWIDLAGGMDRIDRLNETSTKLRQETLGKSETLKVVATEQLRDKQALHGARSTASVPSVTPRANMRYNFPTLKPHSALKDLRHLQGMVDLDKVVVVTGYGEVGPYGNARTRWQMEAFGRFSLEGCIELAWMMGLIKHHRGMLKNGAPYAGWVDAATGTPVQDYDIKAKYEQQILQHTGIRFIEPELFGGYDPKRKSLLQEIVLEEDLKPFEVSAEDAQHYKLLHGDRAHITQLESGQWTVQIKRGATMHVPKALQFDRLVAGQIPTGWDARRYGVPQDITEQVDPITLYVLVSTVEALLSSGITDPYEFYKYVHVTEVGNTSGSGVGGMVANRKIYKDRFLDKHVQQDILQESFINTMAAWVNLLLLSSAGPIKTPVGACATAVESVEIGVETIQTGKAKIVVVGGFDDFQEEGSNEFANMKATSNTVEELAMGREPKEMSRPTTSTRGGFMEAQGAGIHILMSASVAIEMGVPIYGIIAHTSTATDKQGRSIPAPGQGVLTTAREVPSRFKSPMLDMSYRRRQLDRQRQHIRRWVEDELLALRDEAAAVADHEDDAAAYVRERQELIEREAKRQERAALSNWGNDFYLGDPRIAPLRGALAVWGLTIDDIGVASFHGTGTKANDVNESDVVNKQFAHLGRTPGNAVPSIFQKYLTGHPKGAAASWMLNGVLQVLETGIIPGNRNADNIDAKLRAFEFILYPSISITTDGLKAGLLKSFGFGQVGGEVLVLHPDFVLATLSENEYESYRARRDARHAQSYRYFHDALTGTGDFVRVKDAPPFSAAQESQVYLDPTMRATWDAAQGTFTFAKPTSTLADAHARKDHQHQHAHLTSILRPLLSQAQAQDPDNKNHGVGVDVEEVTAVNIDNATFVERNFTAAEETYCRGRPDPHASFAGKWAAKEAVIKAVSSFDLAHAKVWTQGDAAPLKDIEIVMAESGAPQVKLYGAAQEAVAATGVKELKVSISHSGQYAVAVCSAW